MKHPHAEIIKALADDESLTLWQQILPGKGNWQKIEVDHKVHFVAGWIHRKFHLGPTPPPRMIETEYGSYPEPLREAPKIGTPIWRANVEGDVVQFGKWVGDLDYEHLMLRAGVLHTTYEAAKQQAQVELRRRMAELGWEKS